MNDYKELSKQLTELQMELDRAIRDEGTASSERERGLRMIRTNELVGQLVKVRNEIYDILNKQ